MWVRGLKLVIFHAQDDQLLSHPMWVRGLKPCIRFYVGFLSSRTLCGCVD